MSGYYMDEQSLREIIEMVGKTAAAACISAALNVAVTNLVTTRATKIVVEDGIPAALYTLDGGKKKPSAVFISTKRSRADIKPVLFFGAVFLGCKYFLDYREKNISNVK